MRLCPWVEEEVLSREGEAASSFRSARMCSQQPSPSPESPCVTDFEGQRLVLSSVHLKHLVAFNLHSPPLALLIHCHVLEGTTKGCAGRMSHLIIWSEVTDCVEIVASARRKAQLKMCCWSFDDHQVSVHDTMGCLCVRVLNWIPHSYGDCRSGHLQAYQVRWKVHGHPYPRYARKSKGLYGLISV